MCFTEYELLPNIILSVPDSAHPWMTHCFAVFISGISGESCCAGPKQWVYCGSGTDWKRYPKTSSGEFNPRILSILGSFQYGFNHQRHWHDQATNSSSQSSFCEFTPIMIWRKATINIVMLVKLFTVIFDQLHFHWKLWISWFKFVSCSLVTDAQNKCLPFIWFLLGQIVFRSTKSTFVCL